MKRAQSALEFLTTYGWAFLVILIMIGAMSYFGVLEPTRFLPDKCTWSPAVGCVEQIAFNDGDLVGDSVSGHIAPGDLTCLGHDIDRKHLVGAHQGHTDRYRPDAASKVENWLWKINMLVEPGFNGTEKCAEGR